MLFVTPYFSKHFPVTNSIRDQALNFSEKLRKRNFFSPTFSLSKREESNYAKRLRLRAKAEEVVAGNGKAPQQQPKGFGKVEQNNNNTNVKKKPENKNNETNLPKGEKLLIIGLGNPGPKFENTRHNAGFKVIDAFAKRHNASDFKANCKAWHCSFTYAGKTIHIAKPYTFMNLSGESVRELMNYYKIPAHAVLVIVDEVALDVGKIRLRSRGSPGGHNGLKSIQKCLGTEGYPRLRVGVGAPPGDLVNHVLGNFTRGELDALDSVIWDCMDAIETWIKEDNMDKVLNTISRLKST